MKPGPEELMRGVERYFQVATLDAFVDAGLMTIVNDQERAELKAKAVKRRAELKELLTRACEL